MKLKKVISLLLVLMLMLSSINVAFANESSREVIKINGYTVTVVADTKDYKKLEILHDDTQKIEILESIKEGTEWKYISTFEGETYYTVTILVKLGKQFTLMSSIN